MLPGPLRFSSILLLAGALLVGAAGVPAAAQERAAPTQDDQGPTAVNATDARRACEGCPTRHVGMSLLQTTGINVIYELGNLARGQVTARITPQTWWTNMQQGMVWDLDDFTVNQIGHPYAISNHRLLAFDGHRVTFQWKDYAHGDQHRTMTRSAIEFLRRFVQHILPRGFVRIRQSGFLANACRTERVALARTILAASSIARPSANAAVQPPTETTTAATWACPRCGAAMILGPVLSALQLRTITFGWDTS